MIYFVRVNGDTLHNNSHKPNSYVPHEPPHWPKTRFNYLDFCLKRGVVRIGWPDTGDLTKPGTGALAAAYRLGKLELYVQNYLRTFRAIPVGSLIMTPDSETPGAFHMGEVTKPYYYFHNVPEDPYECAHRLGVQWDNDGDGKFRVYQASDLGINTRGGFWRRAFADLASTEGARGFVPLLQSAREKVTS